MRSSALARLPAAPAQGDRIPESRIPETRIHVVQGQFVVSGEPGLMLTTVLGSCVAACIRDPVAGIGGMNHFLLPGDEGSDGLRYGVNAMELLVNGLLQRGAQRQRLQAKLFGGGRLMCGLADIGAQNAAFAEAFLADEGIPLSGGSTGGRFARRLQFWPHTGRTRQLNINSVEALDEIPPPQPACRVNDGAVEFF